MWQRLLCTKGAWGFLQSAGAGGGEGPSEPEVKTRRRKTEYSQFFQFNIYFTSTVY